MILLSGNRTAFWLAGAVCISLLVVSGAADARRGQGGGFSRSSPASSGSVSSGGIENRGAVARQGGSDAARSRAIRNAGNSGQPRSAGSAGGAQSAGGVIGYCTVQPAGASAGKADPCR
jgi:hypothetical protein